MSSLLDNHLHLSRLFFVFNAIGNIFFKALNVTSVIKGFVFRKNQETGKEDTNNAVKSFVSEAQSLLYLHPSLLSSDKQLFKEFHDFTLMCGQPMASVLVSKQENCRKCCKTLVVDGKLHPIVIYSSHRGTYLGCRLIKLCRKCKISEHYGYWTVDGEKHYEEQTLQQEFLQSSEDSAFEMDLLSEYSNLLILGAFPFSTYAQSYNRRFGYHKQATPAETQQKIKRLKRYIYM
jgi:hypothetical protein